MVAPQAPQGVATGLQQTYPPHRHSGHQPSVVLDARPGPTSGHCTNSATDTTKLNAPPFPPMFPVFLLRRLRRRTMPNSFLGCPAPPSGKFSPTGVVCGAARQECTMPSA
eukprot:gene13084-biopygen19999